jgi:hypothetical protein
VARTFLMSQYLLTQLAPSSYIFLFTHMNRPLGVHALGAKNTRAEIQAS